MKIKKAFTFIFECEYKVLLALFLLFCIGIVYGCFSSTVIHSLSGQVNTYSVRSLIVADNLFSFYLKNLLILIFIFISGFSALGIPFICFSIIYYGVTCGAFFISFLYLGDIKVFFASVLCFYFYYFINFVISACLAFSSIRLSLVLINVFRTDNHHVDPRVYCIPHLIKFISYSVVNFLSSAFYIFIANKLLYLLS